MFLRRCKAGDSVVLTTPSGETVVIQVTKKAGQALFLGIHANTEVDISHGRDGKAVSGNA